MVEISFKGINAQVPITKTTLQVGGHRLWYELVWDSFRQDILRINEYLNGFQPRYMESTGPVFGHTAILQVHLV